MFKSTTLLVTLYLVQSALGFGGLFNRYNPAMMSQLSYGNSYGNPLYKLNEPENEEAKVLEELLEEEDQQSNDPCHSKKCTANEHCCDGYVCVDTEDQANDVTFGACLPVFGKKMGESCLRDNDCESGYICLNDEDGEKSCQTPAPGTLGLGEDCRTSNDCNTARGLCCKLQRRARSQPKKICAYYTDSQTCIGPVPARSRRHNIEHTAGEKRMSAHPDYQHFRR